MEYPLRSGVHCPIAGGNDNAEITMHTRIHGGLGSERGFSLIELMVVVGIMATVAAVTMMVTPLMLNTARADSGIAKAMDALRGARELAISQRRNVEIRFIGVTAIQIVRLEIDPDGSGPLAAPSPTVIRTVELENRMQVRLESGIGDTPDAFSPNPDTAIEFSLAGPWMFTSEGSFVNGGGDVTNGTIFLSIPGQKDSSRAISVLGTTALLRSWRWDGRQWVE